MPFSPIAPFPAVRHASRKDSLAALDETIPILKAHFFYSSHLSIDDPLAPVPATTSGDTTAKLPPHPFGLADNEALEEAWIGLSSRKQDWKLDIDKAAKASAATHGNSLGGHEKHPTAHHSESIDKSADKKKTKEAKRASKAAHRGDAVDTTGLVLSHDTPLEVHHLADQPETPSEESEFGSYGEQAVPAHTIEHLTEGEDIGGNDGTSKHHSQYDESAHGTKQRALASGSPPSSSDARANDNRVDAVVNQPDLVSNQTTLDDTAGQHVNTHTGDPNISAAQRNGADDGYFAKAFTKTKQVDDSPQRTVTVVVRRFDTPREEGPGEPAALADSTTTGMPPNTSAIDIPNEPNHVRKDHPKGKGVAVMAGSLSRSMEAGTTGQPFVKLPSRPASPVSMLQKAADNSEMAAGDARSISLSHSRDPTEEQPVYGCKAHKKIKVNIDVPVGVSRLHLVKLPDLQLAPIYWSPVHDTAVVIRGTWFYGDTLLPVEPAVANQLEMGYRELRPWSQTWGDELKSALDVGAIAEEKVAHRLWPSDEFLRKSAHRHNVLSADAYCAASCFHGEASAEGLLNCEDDSATRVIAKKYPHAMVIYKDSKHAFILKPSLHPSAYHGRRPIQKIMKGTTVGRPVVRGFDRVLWEKLHPMRKSSAAVKADEQAAVGGDPTVGNPKAVRAAFRSQDERTKPTDLILVIHGIGQKLSERVESFHFTHAINALRRSIHTEMANPAVQKVLRKDIGGMMVLPVNWRSNLSFDTGSTNQAARDFKLKDITPDTIPAVRNMISDVMLDIPFYMSNHKPKIIEAVVTEANRVYRLWCKNNPGFEKVGRVHIVAHSLGCALAMEVLSKQPTVLSKIDLLSHKINKKSFDFNTVNLFFAGSPAGFFLFLEERRLMPRKGQKKPGAEVGDDDRIGIVDEIGSLGCLAVDNIYNVMHYNDPIAYRLNAAVDVRYAKSLKVAQLPSTSLGFFESLVKAVTPGSSRSDEIGGSSPAPNLARLPSQLEMEVHDFSREEVAERKFYLLNDNGQIDWYTNAGMGMLDNQYINMLGAHSSYWSSLDFIRLVVIECGRKPGRSNALPNMKAVKAPHKC